MLTGQQIFGMILFFSLISWLASTLVTYKILVKKCEHDYEKIYEGEKAFVHVIVYRCSKCGKVQRVKVK